MGLGGIARREISLAAILVALFSAVASATAVTGESLEIFLWNVLVCRELRGPTGHYLRVGPGMAQVSPFSLSVPLF